MSTERTPFTFDRVMRIFFTLLIIALILLFLFKIREALIPFLIGWGIAYLLNPLVNFFQHKLRLKYRIVAILSALLCFIIAITGVIMAIIPSFVSEVNKFNEMLVQYKTKGGAIPFIPAEWSKVIQDNIDISNIISTMKPEQLEKLAKDVAPTVWSVFSGSMSVLMGILAFFIVLLYIIFILLDYDEIRRGFLRFFKRTHRELASDILKDISYNMNRYFRGQALVSISVGILYAVGFRIIDLPMGIIIGLLIGLLTMVPYLHVLGLVPVVLMSLLKAVETGENFWGIIGMAFLVMAIVQVILDSIIVPKIMGKVTGMHPAAILLALSIWGSLMGMLGLIIALPMTTFLLSYYRRYILKEEEEEEMLEKVAEKSIPVTPENEKDSAKPSKKAK